MRIVPCIFIAVGFSRRINNAKTTGFSPIGASVGLKPDKMVLMLSVG
jgi:hypothetical protein